MLIRFYNYTEGQGKRCWTSRMFSYWSFFSI